LLPAQAGETPTVVPSSGAALKPGAQIVETAPGVIQMISPEGK
jgi:hypothetical protein